MGIDAIVYLNPDKFESHPLRKFFQLDEESGELYTLEEGLNDIDLGEREAICERIGNYHHATMLKRSISGILPNNSIMLSQILDQGPVVTPDQFDGLECELEILQNSPISGDKHISYFIASIFRLLAHGRKENNPIVLA